MKQLKTIAILLLILTALHYACVAQVYKVQIPKTNKSWIFQSLDDNKKVATLHKDTLFIHKDLEVFKGIKEQVFELRYLSYKGKIYRYSVMYVDKAYFYAQHKKGVELW